MSGIKKLPYKVLLSRDAEEDFAYIQNQESDASDQLFVLLEEYFRDETYVRSLAVENDSVSSNPFVPPRVKKWQEACKSIGIDIRRIKLMGDFDPPSKGGSKSSVFMNYRIIFFFDDEAETIMIMGIFHRSDFDYDNLNDPNPRRVIDAIKLLIS